MPIVYNAGNVVVLGEVTVEQHGIDHIPKFTGEIWFVDTSGDDDNVGTSPHTAFATIGAAIAAAGAGDAVTVKTGTYDENGLNLNLDGLELWCEIGVIITNSAAGATEVLTVSGNYCRVRGPAVMQAGIQGVVVTGMACQFYEVSVTATTVGFMLAGVGDVLIQCRSTSHTTTGFDISAANCLLYQCNARGTGGATRGFYLSAATADGCFIHECSSSGNATSSYEVVSGVLRTIFFDCISGAGDGRWVDTDSVSIWSNFTFDDRVYHVTTFDNSGPTSDNLFRVYGSVIITEFSGEVATVLAADIGNGYIELDDGTNTIDVTDSPGPAFSSLPVLSFLHKIDDNTVQIAIEDSSQVRLYEDATKFGEDPNFQVTAKAATATYIRLTYSGAGASGAIHWHCQWRPSNEEGWVEAA